MNDLKTLVLLAMLFFSQTFAFAFTEGTFLGPGHLITQDSLSEAQGGPLSNEQRMQLSLLFNDDGSTSDPNATSDTTTVSFSLYCVGVKWTAGEGALTAICIRSDSGKSYDLKMRGMGQTANATLGIFRLYVQTLKSNLRRRVDPVVGNYSVNADGLTTVVGLTAIYGNSSHNKIWGKGLNLGLGVDFRVRSELALK